MIADVLLDEPVAVVAPDDRVGEIQILDHRLQLAAIAFRDLAAEDHRDLGGLADGAVGIQQPRAQLIEGGPAMEDEVVAVLDLGKEEAVSAAGMGALLVGEERGEAGEPLLPAARQILGPQRVGQLLKSCWVPAFQEGIAALLEADPRRPQLIGQPVMLVQADARGKGKVRAHAHEHPAPVAIVHVEVVLDDPALGELQVPAVVLRVPDGDQDPGRLAGLQDDDDLVGLGAPEIRLHELISPARRRVENGGAPPLGTVRDPAVELIRDVAQDLSAHRVLMPVRAKEADHSFRLLEGLDEAIEQDAIKAAIPEADAILMVLVERVHGRPSCVVRYQELTAMNASTGLISDRSWPGGRATRIVHSTGAMVCV
jgi:hypothetical protein